jgi:uncharacterized membrane protein
MFRTRQINPEGKRKDYWSRLLVAYFLTVLMVATALVVAGIAPPVSIGWFLTILTAIGLVFATIEAISYEVKKRKRSPETPDITDESWFGPLYYNSADPSLVVETRADRLGWNFGNKWSWLVLVVFGVILTTPILMLLLLF